ncbi:MAG: hypothetical protein PHD06_04600 [Bacteroidales bacterium]|jgi:hypothetical protein|nr:hypothetical protein [Bacteroidales bacterium]MDD4384439.1 hypothetical protein [Bacteroidales bacterium]MDY0196616.1 hypothetical protein [Tenuifilaceae bacterium]
MKPFKAGQALAHWLLRISLILYIVLLFLKDLYPINLNSFVFYLAAVSCLFAILLLVGGLLSKQGLTVLSGLAITIVFGYLFATNFSSVISHGTMLYLIPCVLGFYFFVKGN